MDRRWTRQLGAVAGLAVLAVAVAACGPEPVAPLSGRQPASPTPSTAAPRPAPSPTTAAKPPARPPVRRPPVAPPAPPASPSPDLSPACLGAVVYPVDATGDLPRSVCLAVGGVLRVRNVDPAAVSAEPADKVSLQSEVDAVDCRLLSPGTVTVTIAGEPSRSIMVVIPG
jgi:hypothetical protein